MAPAAFFVAAVLAGHWFATRTSSAGSGAPSPEQREEAYRPLPWSTLAGFEYEAPVPDESGVVLDELRARMPHIPPEIQGLNGQRVSVRGFVIPVELDPGGERIRKFLLAARNDMGCCFGIGIGVNEWILVDVTGSKAPGLEAFGQATVLGRLEVGEEVESGIVLSLYRMRADRVQPH
jgi:hypothetical protein